MSAFDAEVRRLVAAAFPGCQVEVTDGAPCLPYSIALQLPAGLTSRAARKHAPDSIEQARRFAESAIALLRAWTYRVLP